MIPYVDKAIVEKLVSEIPGKFKVVWWPPETFMQGLTSGNPTDDQSHIKPGLTVFRTGVKENEEVSQLPNASVGRYMGKQESNPNMLDAAISFPVTTVYTIKTLARELSDQNAMELPIWFLQVYKTIEITIPDLHKSKFAMKVMDPTYERVVNKSDGRILWYISTWEIDVDCWWIRKKEYREVQTIKQDFYSTPDYGNTRELIETFIVEPKDP